MDFINPTNDVFKRIHPTGDETCVKTVDSISTEKATVFISTSAGCPLECKFCHLTLKEHKYRPLDYHQIIHHTVDTVKWAIQNNPSIKSKKLKLSWMGMGDALFEANIVAEVNHNIMMSVPMKLDKVDLSTTMPQNVGSEEMYELEFLQDFYKEKFRLFYSLFSAIPETRKYMIPHTKDVRIAINLLRQYGLPVIAHQIFLNGVNDSEEEVNAIIEFVNKNDDVIQELRVLRYNECENSWWFESESFSWIIEKLKRKLNVKLKLQESPGKEIQAACGMFHKV